MAGARRVPRAGARRVCGGIKGAGRAGNPRRSAPNRVRAGPLPRGPQVLQPVRRARRAARGESSPCPPGRRRASGGPPRNAGAGGGKRRPRTRRRPASGRSPPSGWPPEGACAGRAAGVRGGAPRPPPAPRRTRSGGRRQACRGGGGREQRRRAGNARGPIGGIPLAPGGGNRPIGAPAARLSAICRGAARARPRRRCRRGGRGAGPRGSARRLPRSRRRWPGSRQRSPGRTRAGGCRRVRDPRVFNFRRACPQPARRQRAAAPRFGSRGILRAAFRRSSRAPAGIAAPHKGGRGPLRGSAGAPAVPPDPAAPPPYGGRAALPPCLMMSQARG